MKRKRSHDKLKINRIEFRTGVDTIRDTIPTIDKVGRDRSGRANDHERSREEKKEIRRVLARFLVSRKGGGGSKVQLRRKEGSKYAGQVGGEWPTKFWKRVKSGSCLFTRMKKRILSRGGGGDACRVIWNTLCERWIRSMDAEHYFSLSLSRLFARSLSLSNIRHDFFPFLDSPSWQTTRSRVLAHDNFILTCFLV